MDGWMLLLLQLWSAVYKALGVWVLAPSFLLFRLRDTVVLSNQLRILCILCFSDVRIVMGEFAGLRAEV